MILFSVSNGNGEETLPPDFWEFSQVTSNAKLDNCVRLSSKRPIQDKDYPHNYFFYVYLPIFHRSKSPRFFVGKKYFSRKLFDYLVFFSKAFFFIP